MLFGRGEDAQSRRVGGISPGLDIELLPQPPDILRLVIDNWEHPAKEEQVARLYRFHVRAKRRGGGWERNAKVLQPAIGCSDALRAGGYCLFVCHTNPPVVFSPSRLANIIMIDSVRDIERSRFMIKTAKDCDFKLSHTAKGALVIMRSDIVPGALFPDYELTDHAAKRRKPQEL